MGMTKFTIEREGHSILNADAGNTVYRVRVSAAAGRPTQIRLINVNSSHPGVSNEQLRIRVHRGSTGGTFTGITPAKRSDNTDAVETTAGHTGAGGAITPGGVVARGTCPSNGGSFVRSYGAGEMVLAGGQNMDIYIEKIGALSAGCTADIEIDAEE